MSNLLNNPHVLKKAPTEIDNYVGQDRLIDESDVAKLPYLRCIINETMRMFPILPVLVPRESSADRTVGGFRIPHGTVLLVNMWATQKDPKFWVEPSKFKPERFEGFDGCPGEGLALHMVGLALG
ncbi:hypothetical protein ACSBR2_000639 [Camellia fascicularis]